MPQGRPPKPTYTQSPSAPLVSPSASSDLQYSFSEVSSPYDLNRTSSPNTMTAESTADSLDYSSHVDSESYLDLHTALGNHHNYNDQSSLATANVVNAAPPPDATHIVHEMHLALLYLLSNPEEFQRALDQPTIGGATTLTEWNAEYDAEESLAEGSTYVGPGCGLPSKPQSAPSLTPLPYVVFADDAEVVLPQAHTASQLFGIERVQGIELEAAAGIRPLSSLFLRWLALMPGGDHLNLIDPPGLTVMKIAGGRYRVTAAHRVVWTWMNEFVTLAGDDQTQNPPLAVGDLVTLTIVDVFETDNQGKLLSYCPTFDNRAVRKTNLGTEALRKSTAQLGQMLVKARQSKIAKLVSHQASKVAQNIKDRVDRAVYNSPKDSDGSHSRPTSLPAPLGAKVDPTTNKPPSTSSSSAAPSAPPTDSQYHADTDSELHEV